MSRPWIHTYSGRRFYPLDANWQDVYIEDIAHALACTGRFGGHTREFYSVAQHSVLASTIVSPENAKWALLHDSPEAYLGDVPRPIKYSLGFDEYRAAEKRLEGVIMMAFDLPLEEPAEVKEADSIMLVTEARDLMGATVDDDWLHGADNAYPLATSINPWTPKLAEQKFLERWREVRIADIGRVYYDIETI